MRRALRSADWLLRRLVPAYRRWRALRNWVVVAVGVDLLGRHIEVHVRRRTTRLLVDGHVEAHASLFVSQGLEDSSITATLRSGETLHAKSYLSYMGRGALA